MSEMVIRRDNHTLLCQKFRKFLIALCVFRHTVNNLYHRPDICFVVRLIPKGIDFTHSISGIITNFTFYHIILMPSLLIASFSIPHLCFFFKAFAAFYKNLTLRIIPVHV